MHYGGYTYPLCPLVKTLLESSEAYHDIFWYLTAIQIVLLVWPCSWAYFKLHLKLLVDRSPNNAQSYMELLIVCNIPALFYEEFRCWLWFEESKKCSLIKVIALNSSIAESAEWLQRSCTWGIVKIKSKLVFPRLVLDTNQNVYLSLILFLQKLIVLC